MSWEQTGSRFPPKNASFIGRFKVRKTEPRKTENAKNPPAEEVPDESWQAVLYQVLKCNILRGLLMFLIYCGLAWLLKIWEERVERENKYDL